jgi:hypothetical protein
MLFIIVVDPGVKDEDHLEDEREALVDYELVCLGIESILILGIVFAPTNVTGSLQ